MSKKIASLLLLVYPCEFRDAYGPDALQLIRDRWRDERTAVMRTRFCVDLGADILASWLRARIEARRLRSVNSGNGALFAAFEHETVGAVTLFPGMALSLLIVALFARLITPEGDHDLAVLLQTVSELATRFFGV